MIVTVALACQVELPVAGGYVAGGVVVMVDSCWSWLYLLVIFIWSRPAVSLSTSLLHITPTSKVAIFRPVWTPEQASCSTCFRHWSDISSSTYRFDRTLLQFQDVSLIDVNLNIEHIKFKLSEIQHWSIDIEVIFNVEVSKQAENASLHEFGKWILAVI